MKGARAWGVRCEDWSARRERDHLWPAFQLKRFPRDSGGTPGLEKPEKPKDGPHCHPVVPF